MHLDYEKTIIFVTPFCLKNFKKYFKFEKYSITVLRARCKRRKTKFK